MKKALVIGIDDYPSNPLKCCINDASALAKIMETNGDGSPNFSVILKTNVQTKSELKTLIVELFEGENDTALLYFSGHGILNPTGGYLVTPDYKKHDEGVSMDEILTLANASKTKNKIIILDCCYSGVFGSPKVTGGTSSQINEGIVILTASRDTESSFEVNGHGIFTNLLLDSLQGGAADLRGEITPGSVYAYIDQALGPWDQRPVFKTNVTRFTSLRTISPQLPPNILREIVTYFPSPEDHYKLDPSYEETNTEEVEHQVIPPYANPKNINIFKKLQKMQSVGLIVPIDADYMYFAAMNSKSCKLTALGYHYWKLVKDKRI